MVTSYQSTKLENMVKFYVPTWSLFPGPVTYTNDEQPDDKELVLTVLIISV